MNAIDRRGWGIGGTRVSNRRSPWETRPENGALAPHAGSAALARLALGAVLTIGGPALLARQAGGAGQASQPPAPAPAQPAPQPQDQAKPPAPEPAPQPVQFWLNFPASHAFSADVDGGGTSSVTRAGASVGMTVPFQQHHRFTLEMSSEWSFYNFDKAIGLDPVGGDPVGTVDEFQIGARLFIRTATRWGVFGAAEMISAGEPGASFSDTLRFTAYGGARYWLSETLSVSGGLSARTRLEESAFIAPFITIDWQINEQWSLKTSERVLERGTNVAAAYAPDKTLTISLSGGYEPREYRLDDTGFNPGGSLLDERIPVELGVLWKPAPAVDVRAGVGVYLWQRYLIRDSAGNQVSKSDSGAQPFATLGVEFRF